MPGTLSLIVQKHCTSASSLTPEMIMQVATMETCMTNVKFVSPKFEVVKDFARKGTFGIWEAAEQTLC